MMKVLITFLCFVTILSSCSRAETNFRPIRDSLIDNELKKISADPKALNNMETADAKSLFLGAVLDKDYFSLFDRTHGGIALIGKYPEVKCYVDTISLDNIFVIILSKPAPNKARNVYDVVALSRRPIQSLISSSGSIGDKRIDHLLAITSDDIGSLDYKSDELRNYDNVFSIDDKNMRIVDIVDQQPMVFLESGL